MEAAALSYTYRYDRPSELIDEPSGRGLYLATCSPGEAPPHFFRGRLRHPRTIGTLLVSLTDIVRSHFFLPRPALLDPVVTSNDSMLRLEGFSGCCGAYVRVDLPGDAFDAEMTGRGTTNVDVNAPMRAALTQLTDDEEVAFSVGRDRVVLERQGEAVVEKKVTLPVRWLKGFGEVQAYLPRLEPAIEVRPAEARRFARSLPVASPPKRPSFVVATKGSVRVTQRETKDAVRIVGLHRLRVLAGLVQRCRGMRIYRDSGSGTAAFEVDLEAGRFFLLLSPEVYRGFSGEGQLLEALAGADRDAAIARVRAQLAWQNEIDPAGLAAATGLDSDTVATALAALAARGLVGFDAAAGTWFHRELPFDFGLVEKLQPRLEGARKLLAAGGVRVVEDSGDGSFQVDVPGTDVTHRVRLLEGGDRCTCPWFAKHPGERGPCKHILAARMTVEGEGSE
jgi:hypothetical protein